MIKAFKKLLLASAVVLSLFSNIASADSVSKQEPSPSDVEAHTPSKKEIDKVNTEIDLEKLVSALPGTALIGCLVYILQSSGNNECDNKKEEANKNSFEVK